ncbi:23S rRNA (guanine(745)-N(1))-methyltransferase [Erwinia sp. OLTSP20]|uniref:23S rRNA (guanine(745)-N(1))-methyltransferase n=1 Tax=unclassified Erwinia TaxID=2622719 RepID=UPI000C1A8236|nr:MULTISPECIES: 23S rRNA (guanine(745)-N(1))-methyltransferase [unclassified Erwinia]PIJ51430.1 23S rRNA (guanine(745)-N(1))-methyltransferase [Erwinia sp. OAMSP11]PIJ73452.1 23S rRNA (guanine(745)-N(1))-methyltransferase [Erwinia sp. OLSSP12]PIJ85515.1 23S rRNA (guanine(745)-N(1))-methyltransferase [Erwinia sp. OLCASP19]PIJ85913.1 23S rRNA (guanine(745)-N(1))-methyltransferase [Erwinia sp. OLMTSP26]PIJ87394.1 23S rRNA (guanine(745)-N(1))-methyltransferase [Erwinia sp. OLMDSP33]
MCYQCPLCHQPLFEEGAAWRCANRHQFDRAREGYVNLLPVQHKRSKQPGDSAEMMQARRQFLNEGHYQPLQQAVCQLLASVLNANQPYRILDVGCGEGYYTGAIAATFSSSTDVRIAGLDVSREAIRSAARRYPSVTFCVASSQRLPFITGSISAATRIYAPCNPEELSRVIRPGGYLLTVTPGPRHLLQFKALIYQDVRLHDSAAESLPGWTLCSETSLAYPLALNSDSAATLLQMTPFAWRARPEVWGRLATGGAFACETDFMVRLWRHQG